VDAWRTFRSRGGGGQVKLCGGGGGGGVERLSYGGGAVESGRESDGGVMESRREREDDSCSILRVCGRLGCEMGAATI